MSYSAYQTVEEHGQATRTNPTASVSVLVPTADLVAVVSSWIGGYQYINGTYTWLPPVVYARNPGLTCNSVDFAPLGDAVSGGDFEVWKATLNFGIPDQPENQEIAVFEYDIGFRELSVPKSNFEVGGKKLGDSDYLPPKRVPTGSMRAIFKTKPPPSPATWIPYGGWVNSAVFAGLAVESVMFENVKANYQVSADGFPVYSLEYNFAVQYPDWNHIWQPANGWVQLSPKLYQDSFDFNTLATFF